MVRSTHGVNCTGSCSWKVYVKDGIITWETQQTDYPSVGAGQARSTSRAAAPGARRSPGTPTRRPGSATPTSAACCCRCTARPRPSTTATRSRRGRTSSTTRSAPRPTSPPAARAAWSARRWDEATEMVAAAYVHTIQKWGPDRVAGFSPIPAMSMVSHASGARFTSLIGGSMLSFYDWYADLPVASPQVFGDQTDVPESGDWWDAGYLDHVGLQRPGDPHPRRALDDRGALPRPEGRRGLARLRRQREVRRRVAGRSRPAPTARWRWRWATSILKEFFVDRQTPYFTDYTKKYTDLPYLVALEAGADGALPRRQVPHRRRPARARRRGERRTSRPCCSTPAPASRSCPTARSATGSATPARAGGTSTSATSTRC